MFSCVLQQGLLALSGSLIVSILVAETVCASNNDVFKAKLLSSTLFMNGITTLAMCLFGIRFVYVSVKIPIEENSKH